MPTIPSWVNQPDYLGAMRSGAALGLQRRESKDRLNLGYENLLQGREEATNRLQLAYDQLASQEQQRQDILEERRHETAARMAEQLRQHDALNLYRQSNAEHQRAQEMQAQDRLALSSRHNLAMEDVAQQNADTALERALALSDPKETSTLDSYESPTGRKFVRVTNPNTGAVTLHPEETGAGPTLTKRTAFPATEEVEARPGYTLWPGGPTIQSARKAVPAQPAYTVTERLRSPPPPIDAADAKPSEPLKTFASEQEARAEGYEAGDVIYLQGIGKVRLR